MAERSPYPAFLIKVQAPSAWHCHGIFLLAHLPEGSGPALLFHADSAFCPWPDMSNHAYKSTANPSETLASASRSRSVPYRTLSWYLIKKSRTWS
jgi:hypothetical protein